MKFYSIAIVAAIFLSSCLKESIPEAMMNKKNGPKVKATFNCKVNGDPVILLLEDARDQSTANYSLACTKEVGHYSLYARTSSGGKMLYFVTDSLAVGNYRTSTANVWQMWIMDHAFNGFSYSHFIHASGDYLDINITSHANGYISGNFSGRLTPLIDGGTNPYIFGPSSSTIVTEGSFSNVPVFY
ncbi:MAG: hypothetical protein EOO06_19005 [Chitinophagaceae bacterium]|nr:MAG: hypothetical protein EOO06_19005 [Chitinophagaceae bacterium]